ncbi:SAM-dependent methyltransferase [Nocardioides panacisoli]|uniref:HsdM family class I SAM-dependent methyltransferase n=1 Tax=Nocardioides panacisoli TaxID=627624 RepID=UPI001C6284F9|nr:N-6 DNA methylase [Nocardioides panacisoli]QYJ05300.1 SAM-dependent methyltransferase [Nocardioides panacisoli]
MGEERRRTEALAVAHEDRMARVDPEGRRRRGAFYTPPELVAWVLDRALEADTRTVLDPACGTGHFLVAVARRLGVRAAYGSDTDAEAVRIARLRLRAEDPTLSAAEAARQVRVADGLSSWSPGRFDAVVGNPPFLGQLRRRTAGRSAGVGAYTDTSAVFLHHALSLVREGGTVALVQPLSVLGARDAAPVRDAVLAVGGVVAFWSSAAPVFGGTAVRTCVPVVRRGAASADVATWHGADFRDSGTVAMPDEPSGEWGALAAPAFGVPSVAPGRADGGVVGDLATCTADFRDQYYGLVPLVREAEQVPAVHRVPLVTSGLLEPGQCRWGETPTRFAKQRFAAPSVDRTDLAHSELAGWASGRLVPKVLVAGQGRVIEAAVDARGDWLPSVPVLSVVPHDPDDPDDLWRLLAVTLAPPVVAHAAGRYLGTGLTPGSVKVSARQLAALPLPVDRAPWDEAAAVLRESREGVVPDEKHPEPASSRALRQGLSRVASLMCAAYAVTDPAVLDWWLARAGRKPG